MSRAFVADLIFIVHFSVVAFIVLGEILILIGWCRRWVWARNPWFRWAHLGAIALVIFFGYALGNCPLTEWEYEIREAVGQSPQEGAFVGRLLHNILFLDLPEWIFMPMYVAFGLLVAATMYFYPAKHFSRTRAQTTRK